MRIYKHQPLYLIQLAFRRGKEKVKYLTLCDTDINEVKELLTEMFPEAKRKEKTHKKTRIEIRERLGGTNGKYTAVSFYGESVIRTRRKLINYLTKNSCC